DNDLRRIRSNRGEGTGLEPWLAALLLATLGPALGSALGAQTKAPKPGDYYEESVQIGFKLKSPKGWNVTPPGPEDANLVVQFVPPRGQGLRLGQEVAAVAVSVLLFDSSITREEYAKRRKIKYAADSAEWVTTNMIGDGWKLDPDEEVDETFKCKEKDLLGKASVYRGTYTSQFYPEDGEHHLACLVVEYPLSETQTLAIIGNAPGDKRDWNKWEKSLEKIAETFQRIEIQRVELGEDAEALRGPRLDRYNKIRSQLPPSGGWEIHISPNYFVVSNCSDKSFITEIQDRLEAIRVVFEEDFPLEKAYQGPVESDPLAALTEEGREYFETLDDAQKAAFLAELKAREEERSRAVDGLTPAVSSTLSVVKVFENRQSYLDYCKMPQSAGYWWPLTEELCLYEDRSAGRARTFGTLFHEAFHQYMFYYCGGMRGVKLHGWFDEGTADYYAGYDISRGKAQEGEFKLRRDTIRQNIKDGKQAPLETFLNWYQREYYGQNPLDISQGDNYAHGWSLVNFLKRGPKERLRCWKKEWEGLIATYLEVALTTGDSQRAIEESFGQIDVKELEDCWRSFTE
ncbi:MAG: DUF1570 domain-containing protein, partial [Planctomycetota bacterium]